MHRKTASAVDQLFPACISTFLLFDMFNSPLAKHLSAEARQQQRDGQPQAPSRLQRDPLASAEKRTYSPALLLRSRLTPRPGPRVQSPVPPASTLEEELKELTLGKGAGARGFDHRRWHPPPAPPPRDEPPTRVSARCRRAALRCPHAAAFRGGFDATAAARACRAPALHAQPHGRHGGSAGGVGRPAGGSAAAVGAAGGLPLARHSQGTGGRCGRC